MHYTEQPARWPVRMVALASMVLVGACSGDGGGITEPPPATSVVSVAVTPPNLTLHIGASASLTAVALDLSGRPLPGRPVTWTSGDVARVTVTQAGVVTAVAAGGPVTITATIEGRTGIALVRVVSLSSIAQAANDSYLGALLQQLTAGIRSAMEAAVALCRLGASEGDPTKVESCVTQARSAATGAADPTDRAIIGTVGLFIDFIEREKTAAALSR